MDSQYQPLILRNEKPNSRIYITLLVVACLLGAFVAGYFEGKNAESLPDGELTVASWSTQHTRFDKTPWLETAVGGVIDLAFTIIRKAGGRGEAEVYESVMLTAQDSYTDATLQGYIQNGPGAGDIQDTGNPPPKKSKLESIISSQAFPIGQATFAFMVDLGISKIWDTAELEAAHIGPAAFINAGIAHVTCIIAAENGDIPDAVNGAVTSYSTLGGLVVGNVVTDAAAAAGAGVVGAAAAGASAGVLLTASVAVGTEWTIQAFDTSQVHAMVTFTNKTPYHLHWAPHTIDADYKTPLFYRTPASDYIYDWYEQHQLSMKPLIMESTASAKGKQYNGQSIPGYMQSGYVHDHAMDTFVIPRSTAIYDQEKKRLDIDYGALQANIMVDSFKFAFRLVAKDDNGKIVHSWTGCLGKNTDLTHDITGASYKVGIQYSTYDGSQKHNDCELKTHHQDDKDLRGKNKGVISAASRGTWLDKGHAQFTFAIPSKGQAASSTDPPK